MVNSVTKYEAILKRKGQWGQSSIRKNTGGTVAGGSKAEGAALGSVGLMDRTCLCFDLPIGGAG